MLYFLTSYCDFFKKRQKSHIFQHKKQQFPIFAVNIYRIAIFTVNYMKHPFYIFILFVCSLSFASAKETILSGVAESYAGKMLTLRTQTDQIVKNERILSEVTVDSAGFFSFAVDIVSPIQVFIPMDLYNGFIYLEPGKTYQVILPEYIEKSLPQKLDPYFEPTDYLLEIEGLRQGDLNFQLIEFEEAFDFYTMKHLIYGSDPDSIQASVQEMREIFSDLDAKFQSRFKEYRFLLLKNLVPEVTRENIIEQLDRLGADAENPAFWDVFDNVFSDFIPKSKDNREEYLLFQQIVKEGSAAMLFAHLKNRYGITDASLKELTAIKLIADLINAEDFNHSNVVELLRKLGREIQTEQNRELLASIIAKATSNSIGSPAPDFTGTDPKGKQHALSDYKGTYVYLNFGNTQVDQTQKDLNVLSRFYDTYKKDLVIINLFLYDTPEQVARIAAPYKNKMIFLHVDDPDLLRKAYQVQNIPSFFVLDPDGNFLMTKGAEPNDELRIFMQHIMPK